jgi:quercetin dioxygenase-like cupin family protein
VGSESAHAFGPGEGREIRFGPNRLQIKADAQTGSQHLTLLESTLPPGSRGPYHVHRSFEEAFYVLEGEIEYRVGEDRIRATPGTFVFVPMGAPHDFRNVHSGSSRHMAIASDPRVPEMIEELGRRGPEHYAEIFTRYDSIPVPE